MRTLEQALERAKLIGLDYRCFESSLLEDLVVLANEVVRLNAVLDRIEKYLSQAPGFNRYYKEETNGQRN